MAEYYILVKPYRDWDDHQRATVFVKEANYFRENGGLIKEWGKSWELIQADSIEHARSIAYDRAGVASHHRIYS